MRPERDDSESRSPRGLGKRDVRGVVKIVLGEHLPKPTRREEVALRRGSKLEVAQDTVYISMPERSWIRPWRWCRRRQQRSCWGGIYIHLEKGRNIARATGAHKEPSEYAPNHAGDLSRATGHLRAAVVKRRGRPPAVPIFLQGRYSSELC